MQRRQNIIVGLQATLLALSLASLAKAEILLLNYSGSFNSTSTLGGVAFGMPTPFTFWATFDSTTDANPKFNGVGIFPTEVTFEISGFGTFTNDPTGGIGINVGLTDSSYSDLGFAIGLADSSFSNGFSVFFGTATPPFDADVPMPSVLTDPAASFEGGPLVVPLMGGTGDLVITGLADLGPMATITEVPEPSTLLTMSVAAGLVGCGSVRRRRLIPR